MSSDLQSVLELVQMNDYVSLIIITAVVYDYILTFSREIDYIWRRRWSWVSTIFVLVRYGGILWIIIDCLVGSTFVPGPLTVYGLKFWLKIVFTISIGSTLILVSGWLFAVFLNAADLVMILRVYAMWSQSKSVLWILLLIYVPQVIFSVVFAAIYSVPNASLQVAIVQIADFSFCNASWSNIPSLMNTYYNIPRFLFGAALLMLAVFQTVKQSIEMYRATKQWQPNRYMRQLVKDGILYFIVNVLFSITCLLQSGITGTPSSTSMLFLTLFADVTICPMMPRFIISMRELYDRDERGRGEAIDTGFGFSSRQNTDMSSISFRDVTRVELDEVESEGIQLEVMGDEQPQV